MLQTDEEIKEMCEMTAERGMELSLFVGPRGSWDVSAGPLTPEVNPRESAMKDRTSLFMLWKT